MSWGQAELVNKYPFAFQDFSVKMATVFKDFMATYNRTYETKEGRT